MAEQIRHEGIVVRVEGTMARIRIVQASACAACHAKSMCMSADSREKEMDCSMMEPMEVGDRAEVLVTQRMGWKAVVVAYILPFAVLMGTVAVLSRYLSEAWAGTLALCATGVYYVVLSLFKGRLQKTFHFTCRKLAGQNE